MPGAISPYQHRIPLTIGDEHPQYAQRSSVSSAVALANIFVPARDFNAIPDTGLDMTTQIAAAFAGVGIGDTLVFEPGTYICSAPLAWARDHAVWAYGTIFDFGTTNLAGGPALTIGDATGTTQMTQASGGGLTVQRTYSTASPITNLVHIGIRFHAPSGCHFKDFFVKGFACDYEFTGNLAPNQGCQNNTFENFRGFDALVPCRLTVGATGWVNENQWLGGRFHVSSSWNAAQVLANVDLIQILYPVGAAHQPNNNRFYSVNLERSGSNTVRRKIRCEGNTNLFHWCRYEGNGVTDITIGNANYAVSAFASNMFFGGFGLNQIADANLSGIEFLDSGATGNNNRTVVWAGFGSLLSGGNGATSHALSLAHASSSANYALAVLTAPGHAERLCVRAQGTIGEAALDWFASGTGALQNSVSMRSTSPYRIYIPQGLEVVNDVLTQILLLMKADGTQVGKGSVSGEHVLFENLRRSFGGIIKFSSGAYTAGVLDQEAVRIFNVSSSRADSLVVADAGDTEKILSARATARDAADAVSQGFGELRWWRSGVVDNGLFQNSSAMGPSRPMCLRRGIWINFDEGDYDTRISGDTVQDLLYVDASTDRVGIKTATPTVPLDIRGDALVRNTSTTAFLIQDTTAALTLLAANTDEERVDFNSSDVAVRVATGRTEALGGLQVGNGLQVSRLTKAVNYTILITDIVVVATAAGINLALPAANAKGTAVLVVKNRAGGNITVTPNAVIPDTIDGVAGAITVAANSAVWFLSNGTSDWEML